jgi:Putative prokaryotic signal transducing protein
MEAENEWQVLEAFGSEVEARVVESFLRASGVEVQLLDTHMNAYVPSSPTFGRGMRMLVRASDLGRARELLVESRRGSHLEIVGEHTPVQRSPLEKWMLLLLVFAAAVTLLLSYLRPS